MNRVPDLHPVQLDALEADEAAVRVARGRGAIDLAIGETLVRLFRGDRLLQLGYAREVDYARERMGVPARTMYSWVRLARGLAERRLLRRAVVSGAVSPRKAMAVLPVAVGGGEVLWTAAAMTATVAELEKAVRAAGKEPPDSFEVESLRLRMTPAQQDRLDAALGLADEALGFGAPRWQCMEAICQEWLGAFGAWQPVDRGPPPAPPRARDLDLYLRGVEEAVHPVDETVAGGARALDACVQRLLEARRGFDATFGPLVGRIVANRYWRALGYRTLEEYCRERLGVSARSVRQRAWLERQMCALPELREALSSGRLTYSKALLVAKDATPDDVAERIRDAASTSWQQQERETTGREERRNRAAGVRRIWGPRDAAETVAEAIACARAWSKARGRPIEPGEALAVVADHFVEVWTVHREKPSASGARRIVMRRHGGLCAVPGCSRPARHEHHVVFRSRGGSNDLANRVGLCAPHHLHGIHRGYLTVAGRAGERLLWKLGASVAAPFEVWLTEGDDDVRRGAVPLTGGCVMVGACPASGSWSSTTPPWAVK